MFGKTWHNIGNSIDSAIYKQQTLIGVYYKPFRATPTDGAAVHAANLKVWNKQMIRPVSNKEMKNYFFKILDYQRINLKIQLVLYLSQLICIIYHTKFCSFDRLILKVAKTIS